MLELAIRAGIPLIVARTDDLLNLEEVLQAISPLPVAQYKKAPVVPSETLCYVANTAGHPISYLYESFAKRDSVLLVVNPDDPISEAFDAGIIPTPTKLVKKHLSAIVSEEEMAPLMRCLSGLTLKQIVELVKLTQARFGDLLPKNILTMRGRLMGGLQGLAQVELRDELYCPPQQLVDWLDLNAKYFLDPTDPRLTPRGILMAGPPGVGKTVGAKHIAKQLDVPLYRLDLAGALGRFVGECHGEGTEFLTNNGLKHPQDVTEDDLLATMNVETGVLEFQKPTARQAYAYAGEMVSIATSRFKCLITPNHRLLMARPKKPYSFRFASELGHHCTQWLVPTATKGQIGAEMPVFFLPPKKGAAHMGTRWFGGVGILMGDFLKFLGFFLSEGHTQKDKPGYICLSQNPGAVAESMKELCAKLGTKVWVVKNRGNLQISFSNLSLWYWLNTHCGTNSQNYRIPRMFMTLPKEDLGVLLSALNDGDGSVDKKGRVGNFLYTTTSEQLALDVEELAIRMGFTCRIGRHDYSDGRRHPRFRVYGSPRTHTTLYESKHASKVFYEGKVYCFTVPNGTLVTKYQGTWLVSGNSEANLTRVLNTVDQEAPAILLIDEIEKLFKEREDSGVTSRLLSQLLWWLQEHQSRVLVVMTTNDVEALPKELYRAGRIDTTITIEKLSNKEIHQFAVQVLSSFPSLKDATSAKAFTHIKTRFNHPSMPEKMSHAEVVSAVFQVIKERQWL